MRLHPGSSEEMSPRGERYAMPLHQIGHYRVGRQEVLLDVCGDPRLFHSWPVSSMQCRRTCGYLLHSSVAPCECVCVCVRSICMIWNFRPFLDMRLKQLGHNCPPLFRVVSARADYMSWLDELGWQGWADWRSKCQGGCLRCQRRRILGIPKASRRG